MKRVLFLLVVVAYLAPGEALRCYECLYPLAPACGERFDPNGFGVEQTDHSDSPGCIKMVKKQRDFPSDSVESILRSHGSRELSNVVHPSIGFYYCNKDLCNGTSSITATITAVIIVAVLVAWKDC